MELVFVVSSPITVLIEMAISSKPTFIFDDQSKGLYKSLCINTSTTLESLVTQVFEYDIDLEFTCNSKEWINFHNNGNLNLIGRLVKPQQHSLSREGRRFGASVIMEVISRDVTQKKATEYLRCCKSGKHKLKVKCMEDPKHDMLSTSFNRQQCEHSLSVGDIINLYHASLQDKISYPETKSKQIEETVL